MYISRIKVSEEFLNNNGRHFWLGCDVMLQEGEDEKLAMKKAMDCLLSTNEEASEMQVIQSKKLKPKMDIITRKKYDQAVFEQDLVTMKQITDNYDHNVEP